MKNIKFSRLFAAMMFVAVLSFAGCKQQPEETLPENVSLLSEDDGIVGKWADDWEPYNTYGTYDCKITVNKIETASYDTHATKVYIKKISDDTGYLYYQFEKNITGYTGTYPNTTQIEVEAKGKWCAIAYKDLTANSVKMCDAYKTYDFAESLEDAVTLYTSDNGWFDGINTAFIRVEE